MNAYFLASYLFFVITTAFSLLFLFRAIRKLVKVIEIVDVFFGQQITFNDGILQALKLSMKDEYDDALIKLIEESERDNE